MRRKTSDQISEYKRGKSPKIGYTDDSAMTFQLAKSLVECKKLDVKDMAKRYSYITTDIMEPPYKG